MTATSATQSAAFGGASAAIVLCVGMNFAFPQFTQKERKTVSNWAAATFPTA
jgi:hypothetical protein